MIVKALEFTVVFMVTITFHGVVRSRKKLHVVVWNPSIYKSLSNSAAEIQWLHSILQYDLLSVPSYGVIILEKPICIRIPY